MNDKFNVVVYAITPNRIGFINLDDVISNAKIDKENFYQWIEIDKDLIEKINNKDNVLSWNGKKIKEMWYEKNNNSTNINNYVFLQ